MDNSKGACQGLKGMNCSWISRYPEEMKRYEICTTYHCYILLYYYIIFYCLIYSLFWNSDGPYGGYPINISSIYIIETKTNYQEQFIHHIT